MKPKPEHADDNANLKPAPNNRLNSSLKYSNSQRTLKGNDSELQTITNASKSKGFIDKLFWSSNSKWKAMFDIFMLFLVAYSWFTSVFYVAFSSPTNLYQIIFDWIVEVFFWVDLILNFFQEYKDPETYENVRNHKLIAKRYIFKGYFVFDAISVFPFTALFSSDAILTKLLRLLRLPRLAKLINTSRVNQLMKSFLENSSRDERIVTQHIVMYCYKIMRLIIIAVIITYFIGWFWYFVSDTFNNSNSSRTFVKVFGLDNESDLRKLIVSWYFALTTLSTVGYGDYYPISNMERCLAWIIMLLGVAFFSYIMGNFIEIVTNYNK